MKIKSRLIAGSIWSVGAVAVNACFSLAVVAVLTRFLSPSDYGRVAFAWVFIEITRTIMLAGLPDALVRQKEWDNRLASTIFWANVAMAAVLAALTVGIATTLTVTGQSSLGPILIALAPAFIIDGISAAPEARMRHEFRFKSLATRQVLANLVSGVVAIISVFAGAGLWALVIQRLTGALIQTAVLWIATDWRPSFHFSYAQLKPVLGYSLHLMGANALASLNARLVDLLIGTIAGPAALGLYQVAGRGLNLMVQTTIVPMQKVALTAFSKLKDDEAVGRAYLRLTRMAAVVTFPVFYGSAAVANDFILACFGRPWATAGPVMAFMGMLAAPYTLSYFTPPALSAVGKSHLLLRYNIFMVGSTVLAVLIAAPFGVVEIAGANALRTHLILPIAVGVLTQGIGLRRLAVIEGMLLPATLAAIMAACLVAERIYLLEHFTPWHRLAILVPTGGTIYVSLFMIFGSRRIRESLDEFADVLPGWLMRPLARLVL